MLIKFENTFNNTKILQVLIIYKRNQKKEKGKDDEAKGVEDDNMKITHTNSREYDVEDYLQSFESNLLLW